MMIKIYRYFLCFALFILAFGCGSADRGVPWVTPVSGWVIGTQTDEDTGVSTVKILKTADGGQRWSLQTLPAGCDGFIGNDVSAVTSRIAWAAIGAAAIETNDGGILFTSDGGVTWTFQTLPDDMNSRHIKGIKGVSPTTAWAVSLGGDVLKTADGGITWTLVEVRDIGGEILSMTEVNRMDIAGSDLWIVDVAAGENGVIHSSDRGLTWQREFLPDVTSGHGPLAVSAFSSEIAWAAVNSDGHLWETRDGGSSWSKSVDSLTGTADYDDINASSADTVWIACNGGGWNGGFTARVKVTDGSFDTRLTNHYPYMMEGVSPMTDDRAWAVGFRMSSVEPDLPRGVVLMTNDGGVTWRQQTLPESARNVALWKVSVVGAKR